MELSDFHQDALKELINIGYGRAAGSLSELMGHRVTVGVPEVSLHSVEEIGPILETTLSSYVANVTQRFSGPVSGNALLVLDEESAKTLACLVGKTPTAVRTFDENAKEIITEVGNILLNACLGAFGNILQIHVGLSVPSLQFDRAARVMYNVPGEAGKSSSHGLLVHTRFHVKAADVDGFLIIALGLASFDRLMLELEKWSQRESR
jgi:chemotaxis protein CheC